MIKHSKNGKKKLENIDAEEANRTTQMDELPTMDFSHLQPCPSPTKGLPKSKYFKKNLVGTSIDIGSRLSSVDLLDGDFR